MEFSGRVAIVTGGATGIGRAVCESLVRAGARAVVVNYSRSRDEAEETAAAVRELGAQAVASQANVADEEQVRAMVADTLERFGHLDILVNNAGTTRFIPHPDLDALTDEVWDQIFSVNLKGTFYCSRAAGSELRRSRGAIVNVASIAGIRASGSSIPYGVSKAGVMQLTRGLAVALAPEVRVNAVAPGLVATRWFRQSWGDDRADEQEREMEAGTPLQGVATAEHVAQAILGLLASDFVTGQTIIVDGGRSIKY